MKSASSSVQERAQSVDPFLCQVTGETDVDVSPLLNVLLGHSLPKTSVETSFFFPCLLQVSTPLFPTALLPENVLDLLEIEYYKIGFRIGHNFFEGVDFIDAELGLLELFETPPWLLLQTGLEVRGLTTPLSPESEQDTTPVRGPHFWSM
jgi:hypothetical protein